MSTPTHMIIATYDNQDPQLWGPYATTAAAETDRAYLEQHVFSRHKHYTGSIVRGAALPLARPAAPVAVPPPPPLPTSTGKAKARRTYRRREGFYCVAAGDYAWNIGHGYTGRLIKIGRTGWAGYITQGEDETIAKTDAGVPCSMLTTTKAAAELWVQARAREITYETHNMLGTKNADGSHKTFRLPITTPHCCDPSTETYHCM